MKAQTEEPSEGPLVLVGAQEAVVWATTAAWMVTVIAVAVLVSNFGPERAEGVKARRAVETHRVLLDQAKVDLEQVNTAFGQAANELVKMRHDLQSRSP